MKWYFINWDIYNLDGEVVKWGNSFLSSNESFDVVIESARDKLFKDMNISSYDHTARVITITNGDM